MCVIHSQARQPLEAICVKPCSTMAAASGMIASRMPSRIMPPAMPNIPEMKDVDTTATASVAAMGRLIMAVSAYREEAPGAVIGADIVFTIHDVSLMYSEHYTISRRCEKSAREVGGRALR